MRNASQRARSRPSFGPRNTPTRSHLGKRNRGQHRRGPSFPSPTTARFRVALREGNLCCFKLVATRPVKRALGTVANGEPSIIPEGCRFQDLLPPLGPGALAVETAGEARVITPVASPFPSYPSNPTDRTGAFSLSLTFGHVRGSPRFLRRAWGSCR